MIILKQYFFRMRVFFYFALFVAILNIFGCATINISPSLGDLEEVTIEGDGPGKILLIDFSGIINNQKIIKIL